MRKFRSKSVKSVIVTGAIVGFVFGALLANVALGCPMNQPTWTDLLAETQQGGWDLLGEGEQPWQYVDGKLVNDGSTFGRDLITKDNYGEFVLYFEVAISEGGNSGVKYLVDADHAPVGLEYQVLDNERHPDARKGSRRHFGALYDLMPSRPIQPPQTGIYQAGCIVLKDRRVQHWINQELVVDVNLDSETFYRAWQRSKFRTFPWFAKQPEGRIILQDHGDPVSFRKLILAPL